MTGLWINVRRARMLTPENRIFAAPPRCLWCGHILEYLPEDRCPECGNAFDPDNPKNIIVPETRIGPRSMLRHLVRGTPLTGRLPRVQWAGLIVPKFPLFFAVSAALAVTAVDAWYAMSYDALQRLSLREVAEMLVPFNAFVNFAFTALGALWLWLVSAAALRVTGATDKLALQGGARAVYFSAWLLPPAKACRAVFLAIRPTDDWPPDIRSVAVMGYAGFALLRLVYIVQAIRREPTGRTTTALLTVLLSPDCWILMLLIWECISVRS